MREPSERQLKPDLLGCARLILEDACPPERHMQQCCIAEDHDGDCASCWTRYLEYVASGRKTDPYRCDRLHEGGMIGA